MIFFNRRTILYINKKEICWMEGKVPSGILLGECKKLTWSEENLQIAIKEMTHDFPKKIRIVVGEEFSYIVALDNKKGDLSVEDEKSLIPENLQDGWDISQDKQGIVQVMALQDNFFDILKKAFLASSLKIEAIESESVAMARLTEAKANETVIFARGDERVLMGILKNGSIMSTKIFLKPLEAEKIKEFIGYNTEQKDLVLGKAIVDDKEGDLKKIFKNCDMEIVEKKLNPMTGICKKKDITGKDNAVLNILLDKN